MFFTFAMPMGLFSSWMTLLAVGVTGDGCPTLFNFYGDIRDCTKFYRCFWGKAYPFTCPAGTRWSQSRLTCDHEHNEPCHVKPSYVTALESKPSHSEYRSDNHDYNHQQPYDYVYDDYGNNNYHYHNGYKDGYLAHGPSNYEPYARSFRAGYAYELSPTYYDYNYPSSNKGYPPFSALTSFLASNRKK